jgi:hypothetical protein
MSIFVKKKMNYAEAYALIAKDFDAKYRLHNHFSNDFAMFDIKIWSDTPSGNAHKNYYEILPVYNEFFNEVYGQDLIIKVKPEREISDYWKNKFASIKLI